MPGKQKEATVLYGLEFSAKHAVVNNLKEIYMEVVDIHAVVDNLKEIWNMEEHGPEADKF